jgi:2-C-methyl-D-erythritol 2,4-cyclodiphosphate synthase
MIRIGQGLDVHAFEEGRPLILGGVRIADRGGLAGHSDADAVLHAITDALLGAVAAGDIGSYFPSEDARWKGAESRLFLEEAAHIVTDGGWKIANLDVTVIAQKPKLAAHRDPMKSAIASILKLGLEQVSVKATTTDHLGFTGRQEGIAALAVVLLVKD